MKIYEVHFLADVQYEYREHPSPNHMTVHFLLTYILTYRVKMHPKKLASIPQSLAKLVRNGGM